MALFDSVGVGHVIHCGDVGGVEVFEEMVGRPCTFVWGNTDILTDRLLTFLHTVGIEEPQEVPIRLTLDGKTLAVFHGHEPEFRQSISSPRAQYVLHGHTHETRDERIGQERVINPGALHRARRKTVAVLDLPTDRLSFHELRDS